MKKFIAAAIALLLSLTLLCGCNKNGENSEADDNNPPEQGQNPPEENPPEEEEPENKDGLPDLVDWGSQTPEDGVDWLNTTQGQVNLSADGYVRDKIGDFSKYVGTSAYRVVTTPSELLSAIVDAKCHYKNVWDEDTKTYTQVAADGYSDDQIEGAVHVIEIANDLNLGYNHIKNDPNAGVVEDFCRKSAANINLFTMSDMFTENGISQIKVENTSDLLIYSKNGAKITHAGFKLTSDNNVVFRNLEFDEMWQWEDASSASTGAVGDYDAFGWAYFKIGFCGYVWIDHCTFGKSYDGQIDYSNPVYNANAGTAFRAPYGADGKNGLHISWCKFNAGSDDPDGYLYKMMEKIEQNYSEGGTDYLYYNALRKKFTFEEILYGVAMPQKKGFLCGDHANFSGSYDTADDYNFNLKMQISFANCVFKNLEDRIPKLRGGNAYMYNCVVDNMQYYTYRTKLKNNDAAGLVSQVSSSWKCAMVSQCILSGEGGSVKAENCIFRGIDSFIKNNDKNTSVAAVKGGYQLVNCSYQKDATSDVIVGSTDDGVTNFPAPSGTIRTSYFSWHNSLNRQPFSPYCIDLDSLEEILSGKYGAGTNTELDEKLLKADLTATN